MTTYLIEHSINCGKTVHVYNVPDAGAFHVVANIMEEMCDDERINIMLKAEGD